MADLVMVGAGPQALALSCLLLQKRSRLQRRLRIVDPSGRWLSRWQRQMERYEIPWLRSPSPHHPHPNAHALRRFAHRQQRHRQLEGAYGLPHTDLFAAFCREVIAEFALEERVQAASPTARPGGAGRRFDNARGWRRPQRGPTTRRTAAS